MGTRTIEQPASGSGAAALTAGRTIYFGLFFVTMATLIHEVLLTRIFSVTMWYHFAFMAVSIALFGMTVGAIIVYHHPDWFPQAQLPRVLCKQSIWFSLSAPLSVLVHLVLPIRVDGSVVSGLMLFLTWAAISIPFVFSGIVVALVLTRYPSQVSKLYTADLAGAALGALMFISLLEWVDGPNAVLVVALVAALGACCFGACASAPARRRAWLVLSGLGVFTAASLVATHAGRPLLRVMWAKGNSDGSHVIEMWNAFSRVTVNEIASTPFGWGLSRANPFTGPVEQMYLTIDSTAGTPITRFDGHDLSKLQFLRYDIVNLAHHLRPDTEVAAVGVGGGRDVLSALVFNQRSIRGIEINDNILRILSGKLGEYSGHLDRNPKVHLINDEARSWFARTDERFGIIQVSLIDTWAATSAGAFVLTENSLYTTEAWKLFLSRLHPGGILTFSRWYSKRRPEEAYRITALAVQALKERGVRDPRKHIMFARIQATPGQGPEGVGTILVSPDPFQSADEEQLRAVCQRMGFDVLAAPSGSEDPMFVRLTSGEDLQTISDSYRFRIDPPVDDRPFFFQMLRLKDIAGAANPGDLTEVNNNAVLLLGRLLLIVVLLTGVFIFIPLQSSSGPGDLSGAGLLLTYFACIGLGFMFIEISQMQRLILFLGHPTYGLSVVLFSLLLFSGLGSWASGRFLHNGRLSLAALTALVCVLAASGPLTRMATASLASAETPWRIAAAVLLLGPMGLCMGIAFPLGMRLAAQRALRITPWLWGINGAASVCGSVLAACIALGFGISAAYWSGVVCYVLALASFRMMQARSWGPGMSPDSLSA